ncbi:N-terminal machado-Joseph disease like domain [Cryptosporidium sp. chipmunk genotype I]|uniref:N-terminal machado-Joseph disease like domain n=1 Tax=Cryptosporidium sp. chipmunk genotype I TaxID=1280935 RepID=UPI003519E121|nr:N-terminal machado-Joseph disease like domain [Cryptosporidium sp. chipmunk genotype I]
MNTKEGAIVYWEKQGNDRMCALHCLNSLLQGPYFDEAFLSKIAYEIDDMERRLLEKSSPTIKTISGNSSQNASYDGFFSIMVLQECLQRHGYSCTPAANPKVQDYILYPSSCCGYIINSSEHWTSVRCVKGKWFNLDSLKAAPIHIDYFEVSNYLQEIIFSGKSVFVVQKIQNETDSHSIPLPDPDPFLRPIKNNGKQRFYLSASEIENLVLEKQKEDMTSQVGDDNLNRNFMYSKKPVEYAWPTSGGNVLQSTSSIVDQSDEMASEDKELEKALRESAIEFAKSIPLPDEPPIDHVDSIQIRIRSKAGSSFVRRFDKTNSCKYLFSWIEYEMALLGNPIQGRSYSFVSQFPYLKVSKFDENSIKISRSDISEVILNSPSLSDIGINENTLLLLNL